MIMATVELRPGESPESLLRRFRKTVMKNGILKDARKKRHFMSKSEQNRIAKRKAIRRMRRRERQSQYRQERY
jgi:small subunit ribosomal protein S21